MRRAVATATVLLAMSAMSTGLGLADDNGQASEAQTLGSGSWEATPSATNFSFAGGAVPPPQYFSVTNTGTLALVGAAYTLSVTGLTAGTVSVRACTLAWDETLHVCSGVITTIVTNVNSPQSVTAAGLYPASVGSVIRLQILDTGANVSTVNASVSISVDRSQVRAAATTNS